MKSACFIRAFVAAFAAGGVTMLARAAETAADRALADYFRLETQRVHDGMFAGIKTLEDWTRARETCREQLREMLGLSPWPEKTDLKVTITGREELPEFHVEKLHFQSMPGLYVTANLYVPNQLTGRVPAILYVCGHANVKQDGVSYGAKAHYQHHAAWFARHGYVCLLIDTIELGELEGEHHGTYRRGMWWWNARGYTPAGVEAWNSIRALDFLQSRPEVDREKLGMTGRSGGGIYTWWTAALDERVKAAVPVSGITDLHNYVVDGCVTGHCDCMFLVNTYRWDYAKVAALIAPRPLLIGNADKDRIFPLDGVVRLHSEVTAIYKLYGAPDKLGLLITEGPHQDTQDLQLPAFRWFNRFLKGEDPLISVPATKLFAAPKLKVFPTLPADQRTTRIHETFVPMAKPAVPANDAEWRRESAAWLEALREKAFGGWPAASERLQPVEMRRATQGTVTLTTWEYTTGAGVRLPLYVFAQGDAREKPVRLHVLDERGWAEFARGLERTWPAEVSRGESTLAYLAPRGIGPTAWSGDDKTQVQLRRRFMLLGQTVDGMRVWDIRRAVEALRDPAVLGARAVSVAGERHQGVNALYASLFVDGVSAVEMIEPPASHGTGPDYLNVLRFLDVPQAVAMAASVRPVKMTRANPDDWSWPAETARRLGWPAGRLEW
jgi:dienelactone hydrolase